MSLLSLRSTFVQNDQFFGIITWRLSFAWNLFQTPYQTITDDSTSIYCDWHDVFRCLCCTWDVHSCQLTNFLVTWRQSEISSKHLIKQWQTILQALTVTDKMLLDVSVEPEVVHLCQVTSFLAFSREGKVKPPSNTLSNIDKGFYKHLLWLTRCC